MNFFKSNYNEPPETIELKETIAHRIKELRQRRRMMQKDVAELASVNVFTYSGYENARALPPIDILLRIAEIYGASLDFITGRIDITHSMVGDIVLDDDCNLETRLARVEKALRENSIDY